MKRRAVMSSLCNQSMIRHSSGVGATQRTSFSVCLSFSFILGLCLALNLFATHIAIASTASSASPRPITHEDLWLMPRVGAPSVSPNGRWVIFAVAQPAYERDEQRSDLWLVPADGSQAPRRVTSTAGGESDVDWSPDSRRIVFSARREGDEQPQLYLLDLERGGEAQRLTELTLGARAPRFSPNGRQIAFSGRDYPGAKSEADNQRIRDERKARKWNARVYEGFPIRNWDRWLDDQEPRLHILTLKDSDETAPETRELLRDTTLAALPGFATSGGGQVVQAVWTPDGEGVVFVASVDRDRSAYQFTSSALWWVSSQGGEPQRLTADGEGAESYSRPQFTLDGRRLVAGFSLRTDKVFENTELRVFDWSPAATASGRPAPSLSRGRSVTENSDLDVGAYAVAPDSRSIYFLAEQAGHEKLFQASLSAAKSQDFKPLVEMDVGVYSSLSISRQGRAVLVANFESATQPPEVVRIDLREGRHERLSQFTVARAAELDLAPVEHFWFESDKGRRIHNMLVRPPGFDPTKKYPLLVLMHGGPHTMWRDQWVLRWNYHLIAASGYVVLLTNYSGSTGFGEAAAQSIQGDPLRTAAAEINQGADVAIERYAFIDGSRQCAAGASYGGHLANWMQASTERYRCLVSHAGLVNLESQWGTSDGVYHREVNNGGPVWEQGPVWREQNPIRYAANFRTPTLVTIGEQDFRVPLNNSLEYWTVLQRQQIESRLVVFPDENHWILKGENSRFFYQELAAWLERWLGQ
jgi:dipeptidyl aminopeptidase/acylaminoacyl peptidase